MPARLADEMVDAPVVVLAYSLGGPATAHSVFPPVQNLLLAARALGYGGALTMWHLGVEAELSELLGIPDGVALSACITLGVPEGHHGPVKRKPLDKVVFDDLRENAVLAATLAYAAAEDPVRTPRDRALLPVSERTGEPGAWPECGSAMRRPPELE